MEANKYYIVCFKNIRENRIYQISMKEFNLNNFVNPDIQIIYATDMYGNILYDGREELI